VINLENGSTMADRQLRLLKDFLSWSSILAVIPPAHREPVPPAAPTRIGIAELIINLNAQQNYELIVNLLNPASTNQTGATSGLSIQA